METVVKALYNASFAIWNTLIGIAMTIFRTSPTAVSGGTPYGIVHSLYTSISAATIPIATCFFVIAIYKSVVTAPPEQQAQRFLMDGVRYCIILFVAANLWQILGYIMEFSDGITATLGGGAGYMLSMDGDLERIISESLVLPEFELSGEWIGKLFETLGCCILLLIGGVVLILVMVASSLSIISSAFERILKPLVLMPFAGIAVAMGAGGHKHQLAKANHVKKTIRLVALAKNISIDCVTVDDIFAYQGKVGDSLCLKKEVISEVLGYMNTPVHNDGMEEFDVPYMDSDYEESEKNETKELLRAFFDNLRGAQKYIFLQRCQAKEEGATVKQMAKDERLIVLCLLDEVCKRNITVGNLSIMRPKGKMDVPQIEEVYENIQYVKLEFIDYMYRDAKKRLIGYIRDHGLRQQDLEGCLGDLLDEEWDKIKC